MDGADKRQAAGVFHAAISDLNGLLRGKRLPLGKLAATEAEGLRLPLSAIGVDIWGTDCAGTQLTLEAGDPDGLCLATGRGLVDLGWDAGVAGLLPLWMSRTDGRPYFGDARQVLAHVLERYAARGLTPVVATELEFYLLDPESAVPRPAPARPGDAPPGFDNIYSVAELESVAAFLAEVDTRARACGIPAETATAEGAPRQFELVLTHQADALKAADDTALLKHVLRNAARRHGQAASFMAKPYPEHAGSGLHVHVSILDRAGRNILDDGGAGGTMALRHAVGGMLAGLRDSTLVFAPHLNSYRRLTPGGLAPTAVDWGYDNRTSALRIPAGPPAARRIEHRVAGADANPHLVIAAILGAALQGLETGAEPPPPVDIAARDPDPPRLAPDWRTALEVFRASEQVGRLLHPECVRTFAACKAQEQEVFAARVTQFEIGTYLHRV